MSHLPPDPAAPADPAVERAAWRLEVLRELTEIGMGLARDIASSPAGEAADDEAPAPGKGRDPADAFSRLSRAIRLTVSLHAKADEALRERAAGAARQRAEADAERRRDRVATIEILVMEAAEAETRDLADHERLGEELEERLDAHEEYWGDPDRPLRDAVESLCRFYGLSPDWSRWDGEGWTQEGGGPPWAHGWPWDGTGAEADQPAGPGKTNGAAIAAGHTLE